MDRVPSPLNPKAIRHRLCDHRCSPKQYATAKKAAEALADSSSSKDVSYWRVKVQHFLQGHRINQYTWIMGMAAKKPSENRNNGTVGLQKQRRVPLAYSRKLFAHIHAVFTLKRTHDHNLSGLSLVGLTCLEGLYETRWIFTASGPMTNLAARLAGLAKPGQILVGPETVRRLGQGYDLREIPHKHLKNLAKPIDVYSLVGVPYTLAAAGLAMRRC